MANSKQSSFWGELYLFMSIIWNPLQNYYLHIDGNARTLMILAVIAIITNIGSLHNKVNVFKSSAFICWITLLIYSLMNVLIQGNSNNEPLFVFIRSNFLNAFVFLSILMVELQRDYARCLKIVFIALVVYMLLGLFNMTLDSDMRVYAYGLGNTLPLMSMVGVFIAEILLSENRLRGRWWTFSFLLVLALFITIASATRKALGALAIVLVFFFISQKRRINTGRIIIMIIIAIIIYFGSDWVLENTFMGERLTDIGEQYTEYELSSNPVINKFWANFLGDRTFFYYYGLQIFHQHPITGIGLTNFQIAQDTNVRIHSEYIVQLCENGIIGFVLLILFYVIILKRLLTKKREGFNIWIYLGGLLAILFLNFTAWTYNSDAVMILYAVLLNFIYSDKNGESCYIPLPLNNKN